MHDERSMNAITLNCAGESITHTITSDDVAGFIAARFTKPSDRDYVKSQVADGLRILDYAFDIGKRIGFAEVFGKNREFQAYLLNQMKGA
jgi:hypothetical protein